MSSSSIGKQSWSLDQSESAKLVVDHDLKKFLVDDVRQY